MRNLMFTICLLSFGAAYGQNEPNWVRGEVLVQLIKEADANQLTKEFATIGLSKPQLISRHVNIWKFEFNSDVTDVEGAIDKLHSNGAVIMAQRNHILKNRATPNDTQYGQQWQYYQANDKDIDAPEAWDVTTGGTMTTGDKIVVCVIDDGVRLNHPDLVPNLWTNANEIANNGIDDDNNGYVDDVRGWNAYTNNDDVSHIDNQGEGHGSAVAGIVGAKGNNGQGVTGVNWDVELMIVKGGGQESEAIAAYSYALENRKLYNSTNGQKGAFVVATNASWGIDGGLASQAPLWCAMYDTLGNYGILNAGAGPNANTNVDTQGDLPTQCPSNFLIGVTNTDQTDTKVTQAGYGVNSIDLGAPGEGALTVDEFSTGYATFGGTSGATPHVAGTIALLYSAPCASFANLAKTNPKAAAEQVRTYILNGVDANSSLNGITSTGGRLNVNNSVQALMAACASVNLSENKLSLFGVEVYPNPMTGDELTVSLESKTSGDVSLEIIDLSGKRVSIQDVKVQEGMNKIELLLPSIKSGVYQLRLTSDNWTSIQRFVK